VIVNKSWCGASRALHISSINIDHHEPNRTFSSIWAWGVSSYQPEGKSILVTFDRIGAVHALAISRSRHPVSAVARSNIQSVRQSASRTICCKLKFNIYHH
jgi:hypothetical protein